MKRLLLMTVGLCLSLCISYAQPGHHGPQHHKHHPKLSKEAKEELHNFHKETIYPVKKAAHDKFRASLSADDIAFLDKKRAEGRALQEEAHQIRKKVKALKKSGMTKDEMRAKMKESFAPMKEKQMAFMKSMKPFMERNKELIQSSLEGLKEQHEDWKKQKMAILDKHLTDEQKEKMELHRKKMAEKRAAHPERAQKHEKHHKMFGAVKFVLWDGEMKTPKACKKGDKECQKDGAKANSSNSDNGNQSSSVESVEGSVAMNLSNYPNPAMTQTTIIFELGATTKKVSLMITDVQGKQMWKKNYNKLNAGEHKVDVDLRKFANGQYFYTLEANGEQVTKTLIVNQ